ncbi:GNAT family N-acetyltransferase [Actinacidiphila bryophytorum]|uniref:GNAT family N-acetyltransferase n=1 Tax=Actinacidiphila bryophytorum TaxID=1436133 RepID=UPI002176C6D8|nr:GNAT family N-acetyltransferase [Actinacidiphila bryophytorum]UWE07718.1 GNAT family N-acetyltransferase [Actinacidiphila bryophytorum]
MTSANTTEWTLRPATAADVEPIAELRAVVMRPDLVRLGRYDEHRVRQRFRDAFDARHTCVVTVGGELAGCLTVRPVDTGLWLEHFYLAPHVQGRGLGSAVLRSVLARADAAGTAVGLVVLQGSPARRLYERHGFAMSAEDPVDVTMTRPAPGTANA